MLTSLRVRDFKAYKDSKLVPLRPFTVILGANNSGKSSLLHAILLLAQTVADTTSRQPLVTSGAYVDLGGYYDIVWGGQAEAAKAFAIALTMSAESADRFNYARGPEDVGGAQPTDLDLRFTFDRQRNAIVVAHSKVTGGDTVFVDARRRGRGYAAMSLPEDIRGAVSLDFRHFIPALFPKHLASEQRLDRNVMNHYFAAQHAFYAWSGQLELVSHVAPLRQPVPRFGILGKSPTSDLGPGGENLLRVLRAGEEPVGSGERLTAEVSKWVSEEFKMLADLRLIDVDQSGTVLALVGDERHGFRDINVANMGEGISQLLPIITRVLTTPADGSLLIEQPELHLHPAAQADLADLFIDSSRHGERQYIVETHSEHLLLRLRRRIAEGRVSSDDVCVLYVERGAKSSTVRSLDLDASGHFIDWPDSFFDERYKEALSIVEAQAAQNG